MTSRAPRMEFVLTQPGRRRHGCRHDQQAAQARWRDGFELNDRRRGSSRASCARISGGEVVKPLRISLEKGVGGRDADEGGRRSGTMRTYEESTVRDG
jgi:hypothetical protein